MVGLLAIFHIQLHQRLGVFRNEGDGADQQRHLLGARAFDFGISGGTDPFLRCDAGLVANLPVQIRNIKPFDDLVRRALNLPLIGVAPLDDALRQAMGAEQDAQLYRRVQLGPRLVISLAHDACGCIGKTLIRMPAAQGLHRNIKANAAAGITPSGHAAARRGGGELRIERHQHHPLRPPILHRLGRFLRKWMPVAHGDKAAIFAGLIIRQRRLQALRLLDSEFQQGRFTAQHGVILLRCAGAPLGDELAEPWPDKARHAQNRRVAEQVGQEGLYGVWAIRAAQVQQHNRCFGAGHKSGDTDASEGFNPHARDEAVPSHAR